ncbi:TetR family transcriptional regulator [Rhodococcus hoagii]|nr:TetR family transcriptional regulator [Prescottella equi]
MFAAKGYTGTSMRDIASATGMLAGSLYYHFESKEALAATMVADLRDDILAATQQEADPSDTPIEALRRFANAVADASARHPVRCRCASVSRRPRIRSWRRCWRPNHGGRTASGRHW